MFVKRKKKIFILILIIFVLLYYTLFNHALNYLRYEITEEMKDFDYPNGRYGISAKNQRDLTLETGGTPIRNLIISTWRSGSTFLGEILNLVPGTYYHYEPLIPYEIIQIRGSPNDKIAIRDIKKLFNCDYSDMETLLDYGIINYYMYSPNTRLWNKCNLHPNFCFRKTFLEPICKLYPVQLMKLVRLRLNVAARLLEDTSMNIRILLLVRDPRGVMESRQHKEWCPRYPDCADPKNLCSDMVSDYEEAKKLTQKYPMTFKAVRYEDLAFSPEVVVKEILKFYGLPFTDRIAEYLEIHTKEYDGNNYSTYRDSKSVPFHWIKDSSFNEIENIQKSCKKAMRLWGYKELTNFSETSGNFNPLLPFDENSF